MNAIGSKYNTTDIKMFFDRSALCRPVFAQTAAMNLAFSTKFAAK
eukprot:CAMPEP_0117734112 /NCGR_PEP_ID=MMETSP0947-20121206/476_1 /TAXON_ID=44440 /ORGANISM="Chattonella subsalsa, Strain CCMP2191" /LENGTH=44 /DNA_ID= /DNA_START= /DNA_END= /DNA_ORIENTATION=